MAATRARATLFGLVFALCASLSPAAASLTEAGALARQEPAGDRVLEPLRETAAAAQAPAPAREPPAHRAFTPWPAPSPQDGHLFVRTPEPPLVEPAVPETWMVLEDAGSVWSGPEGDLGRVDPAGARREVETVYEPASGRVLEERFGGGFGEDPLHAERFEYSSEGAIPWPTAETSLESVPGEPGLVETFRTSFGRDVFGRTLLERRSDGEEHLYLYDRGSEDLLRVRTGAGTEASYGRDGRGLPVKVVRPRGRGTTLYSWDLDGRQLVQTSATADGATQWQTTTTYDSTGRVAAMDYADGTREERTYFPDSQVATVTTRDGITLGYTYDAANRPQTVVPSGGAGTTLLDAGDAYSWDPLSRPTQLERGRPGVTGLDSELAVAYPSYDLASRPSAEVVGSRDFLAWSWDVFSRPSEVHLPAGPGRAAGGAFEGFSRSYDTLDHLASAAGLGVAGLSATPLGATWSWGGASRLYAMTTKGALGTGMRLGYHQGAGPQIPGQSPGVAPEASSAWKLGRLSWGAVGSAGPTAAPAVPWGDFGYGWRGDEGAPSDGAKVGRQVLGTAAGEAGVLAGLGWSWGYDAGVRLGEAVPGPGSLTGTPTETGGAPDPEAADRFTFGYGAGDELQERVREATGAVDRFTLGDYGRIAARDGAAFGYDPVGRRLEDDRFVYRWDWRGQLVSVEVKASWPDADGDGEPDVSPYAGQKVSYVYDARGRLERRLHEGVAAADGTRPFIEERRYVWEEDRLAAESAYGPSDTGENLRWRRTYVPGPSGLDDPTQVVMEVFQPGSPYSGEARTYTYLHDELGTIVGLVAEDEGTGSTDRARPPVPIRYRYTPYGEAHAETGPELLRARYRADLTEADTAGGTVTQAVADATVAAPGGVLLSWSIPLDEATLASGLAVEQLQAATGWTAVPAGELILGHRPDDGASTGDDSTNLRVVLASGWERGTSYRIRLTPVLADRLGRGYGQSQDLQWSIPAAPDTGSIPPVQYDQRFPTAYESYEAAGATAAGRFPAGQSRLFQGLWTDPVTGLSYARARWYDARNATWLSEDPLFDRDSPNLYAFVAWGPNLGTDPMGLDCLGIKGPLTCKDVRESFLSFGALKRSLRFGEGEVKGLGNTGKGLVHLAAHPIQSAKAVSQGAANLAVNWDRIDVEQVASHAVTAYVNADEDKQGEIFGETVLSTVLLGGVGNTAEVERAAALLEDAASIGKFGDELGEATAAGINEGAAEGVAEVTPRFEVPQSTVGIKTPYGVAIQEESAAAREALAQVRSGTMLYRQGTLGVQETTGAQFWSLKNPAVTPGFAAEMGMPGGAAPQVDWIMGGVLRESAPVITRTAPGLGGNAGGAMEAVVNPGAVASRWFYMP